MIRNKDTRRVFGMKVQDRIDGRVGICVGGISRFMGGDSLIVQMKNSNGDMFETVQDLRRYEILVEDEDADEDEDEG